MCISWQQNLLLLICTLNHNTDESRKTRSNLLHFRKQPQSHVSRNLVIPRTTGMQLSAQRANEFAQAALVGRMYVFVILLYLKLICAVSCIRRV